jgi:hypothetical protein
MRKKARVRREKFEKNQFEMIPLLDEVVNWSAPLDSKVEGRIRLNRASS